MEFVSDELLIEFDPEAKVDPDVDRDSVEAALLRRRGFKNVRRFLARSERDDGVVLRSKDERGIVMKGRELHYVAARSRMES